MTNRTGKRGFAQNPELARTAGQKGGEVAHQRGTAHEFTSSEARIAGRKGGKARSRKRS